MLKIIRLFLISVKAEGGNTEGYPVNSLFSIKYKGLDHLTGVPTFVNEKGEISPNVYLQDERISNLVFEGSVDPKFTGWFFQYIYLQRFFSEHFCYLPGRK
jgi:hypothetical protein